MLYEPLGVVLFVTPLFSMRKSFYTVSIPSWLFLCVHAVLDHITPVRYNKSIRT